MLCQSRDTYTYFFFRIHLAAELSTARRRNSLYCVPSDTGAHYRRPPLTAPGTVPKLLVRRGHTQRAEDDIPAS